MKHLILTNAFIALCFVCMAQNKKQTATKKTTNDSANNTVLKQEKIWPGLTRNVKNTTPVITTPNAVITWNKL